MLAQDLLLHRSISLLRNNCTTMMIFLTVVWSTISPTPNPMPHASFMQQSNYCTFYCTDLCCCLVQHPVSPPTDLSPHQLHTAVKQLDRTLQERKGPWTHARARALMLDDHARTLQVIKKRNILRTVTNGCLAL